MGSVEVVPSLSHHRPSGVVPDLPEAPRQAGEDWAGEAPALSRQVASVRKAHHLTGGLPHARFARGPSGPGP